MLTFTEFLSEKVRIDPKSSKFNFKFALAHDIDYLKSNDLITFDKNDKEEYKKEKDTSGISCHAYSHLIEFDPSFVDDEISKIKESLANFIESGNKLINSPDFCVRIFGSNSKSADNSIKDQIETIKSAPRNAIINYMDLINDKIIEKKELSAIEKVLVPYIDRFTRRYAKLIEFYTRGCIDIDDTETNEELIDDAISKGKLSLGARDNKDSSIISKLYLITKIGALIIERSGTIRTMFKVSHKETDDRDKLLKYVKNRYTFNNKLLQKKLFANN